MVKNPSVKESVGEGATANKFSNLFEQRDLLRTRQVLKWKEFMCMAFFSQMSLSYISLYINLALKWGIGLVTIFYPIIAFISGIPLAMMNLFLGHYSKCGYIMLWECTPLFKGFSYSIALVMITNVFYDIAIGGLICWYILHIFRSTVPWSTCEFSEATKFCYDGNKIMNNGTTQNDITLKCCLQYDAKCMAKNPDSYLNFSSYEYFRHNKLRSSRIPNDWNGHIDINITLVVFVGLIWGLLLLLMIKGVPRFRGIMLFFWIIIGILMIPIFVLSVYISPKYSSNEIVVSDFNKMFRPGFWIELIFYSIDKEVPANFIILGKQTPSSFSPFKDALSIHILKFLTLTLIIMWFSIGLTKIQVHYVLEDIKCIHINGIDIFFVVIPDMLMQYPAPQLWLILWFFILFIFSLFSPLITLVSCVDSLTDAFPIMARNRTRLCFILAFVCFLGNCAILNQYFLHTFSTWLSTGSAFITAVSLLAFVIAMFFYSVQRIAYDFYFTFGKPVSKSLIHGLKLSFLITAITCSMKITQLLYKKLIQSKLLKNLVVGLMSLILLPAIIILFYNYFAYLKQKKVYALILPSAKWGPDEDTKKQARLQFDPQREVHCTSRDQRCRHNCLLNSTQLKLDILRVREVQETILKSVKTD